MRTVKQTMLAMELTKMETSLFDSRGVIKVGGIVLQRQNPSRDSGRLFSVDDDDVFFHHLRLRVPGTLMIYDKQTRKIERMAFWSMRRDEEVSISVCYVASASASGIVSYRNGVGGKWIEHSLLSLYITSHTLTVERTV